MTLAEALRRAGGAIVGATGSAINAVGNAAGNVLPEMNVSENLQRIGGMLNPRPVYASDGSIPADVQRQVEAGPGNPPVNPNTQPGDQPFIGPMPFIGPQPNPNPAPSGGGNGGGNGGGTPSGSTDDLINALITKGGYNATDARNAATGPNAANLMNEFFSTSRSNANDQAQKALEAAIGVFNTKAQNLRDQIPGIESARDLRVRGLDESLGQFNDTASREEASRLATIKANEQATQDTYGTAERKTRVSAKSLANKLRNMFAGAGTLDSTQYKDMNIDQSKEILQSLGDIRREGAGKLAISKQEQDDLSKYYAEQKTQFDQKTKLAQDQARAEADTQIRGVLGDINLTDSQKIEAVTAQQAKLQDRLSAIDEAQANFKVGQEKDAQDLAIKLAELKSKGTSTAYNDSLKTQKALTAAVDVVNKIATNMPGANKAEIAAKVFASYPELKDVDPTSLFGSNYTTGNTDQKLGTLYGAS